MAKCRLILASLLFICLVVPANGQMEKGDSEVQFSGMFMTFTETGGGGFFMVQGRYGYYITDNVQLGIGPSYMGDTEGAFGMLGLSAFGNYVILLEDGKTAPYGGAQFYRYEPVQAGAKGSSLIGLTGGVKYYLTPKTAIDGNANYQFALESGAGGGVLLFLVGFSFLF